MKHLSVASDVSDFRNSNHGSFLCNCCSKQSRSLGSPQCRAFELAQHYSQVARRSLRPRRRARERAALIPQHSSFLLWPAAQTDRPRQGSEQGGYARARGPRPPTEVAAAVKLAPSTRKKIQLTIHVSLLLGFNSFTIAGFTHLYNTKAARPNHQPNA